MRQHTTSLIADYRDRALRNRGKSGRWTGFRVFGAAAALLLLSGVASAQTLQLYYPFEDNPGDPVGNFGALATSGTMIGGAPYVPSTAPSFSGGQAVRFTNNDGQFIDTGLSASALGFTNGNPNGYASAAWVNMTANSGDSMVFGQGSTPALHNGVRGGNYHQGHWGNDITVGTVTFDAANGPGNWHFVVWEYAQGVERIYVDGVNVGEAARGTLTNNANVQVGRSENGGGFDGLLDDVMVFSLAAGERMYPNQIQHLASGGDPFALPAGVVPDSFSGLFTYAKQTDGTWNRVELHRPFVPATYVAAAADAIAKGGHLFTPRSRDENAAVAGLASGTSAWIGLDDTDVGEGGTGEGAWSLIDEGSGREIIWNGLGSGLAPPGAPVPGKYHNWNAGGEPNDAGGEDAAEILSNGRWNDLPHNNGGVTRNYMVEYETRLANKPDPAPGLPKATPGMWNIRRIDGTPNFDHVRGVEMALYSGIGVTSDYQAPQINFFDENSGDGRIGGGTLFPGNNPANADENNFAIYARGRVRVVEEGDYTFGFTGDDGSDLQIHGVNFISSSNFGDGGNIDLFESNLPATAHNGDHLAYPNPTGDGSVVGVVHLTPGDYDLTYQWYENGGGAHTEVYVAKGAHTSVNARFKPVGVVAQISAPPTLLAPFASGQAGMDVPGWDVVRVNGPNSIGAAITAIEAVFNDPLGTPNNGYEVRGTINYHDPEGGGGNIGYPQVPFPGNTPAGEDNFAIGAASVLTVNQTGLYRFTVLGDDGSQFRLQGSAGWTAGGIASVDGAGDGIFIAGCCADGYGEVFLNAGEQYIATLIWNEIGGGAYVSVRYSIDGQGDFLLGSADTRNGLELVPEPSSFALAGFGLAGLFVGLRRRRK